MNKSTFVKVKRKKLFELLERRNKTAYSLAKEIGYKPQAVYNWLYGIGAPSAAVMLKLTDLLEVTAEEILKIFAE